MGSWNGTCGISHLPIRCGDEIVALLIGRFSYEDSPDYSGYCYVNGMYQPLTLPIYCTYDDYGGISNVENPYVLELIRDNFKLDPQVNVVSWINDEVERDKVTIQHQYLDKKVEVGVGLWMVHRKIFEKFQNRSGVWWTKNIPLIDVLKQDAQLVLEDIRDPKSSYNKEIKKYSRILKQDKEDVLYDFLYSARTESFRKTLDYDNYFLMGLQFGTGYSGTGFITKEFFNNAQKLFVHLAKSNEDNNKLERLIADVIGATCLNAEMSNLRMGYMPQSGKGSQSEEYNSYIALMKTIAEIITDVELDRKENDIDFYTFDW